MTLASLVVAAALLAPEAAPRAQVVCPQASGADAETGWAAYRDGDVARARTRFAAALGRCPRDLYAMTGLGYVALREGADAEAGRLFGDVAAERPDDVDALVGLGLVAWRAGDLEAVRVRFLRVAELVPDHPTALEYLGRLPAELGPAPERPPLVLPDTLVFPARTRGDRFEVRTPRGWEPFYIKGVNLGAALPGRNPSEFPDSATYVRWIADMAGMNANTVRVYTVHPPHFYKALREHNLRHPGAPLWLIHGVWTELPEKQKHDYLAPAFEEPFFTEMERVVDVLHGRADLAPRPGHATGYYTADVSPWTLAHILGREWEPYSAMAFDSLRADFTRWEGRFVSLREGNPMEAWLAKAADHIVAYETDTYRQQRPVAYTNWPTLDPLDHPTESTRDEEVAIRRALGETVDFRPREYDNDVLGLDATRMRASPAFPAGVFASYHAYPYYPDFMGVQPSYAEAASSFGPSRYFGYLRELKARHPGMPLVISEYGVPASFGSAHLQPQGLHHGGLDEAAMAEGDRRLTRELAEAGMAGGAVFAWMDEWFKRNWLVVEFELPADRNRLWYNRLDAEQHYGMIAMDAEPPLAGVTLAERRAAWADVAPLYRTEGGTVRAAADAAYLWLYVETPGRRAGDVLHVGLDMIHPEAGDRRWPGREGPSLGVGLEFVVTDDGREVRVLADPPMNPFRMVEVGRGTRARPAPPFEVADPPAGLFRGRLEQRFNLPYRSVANDDGRYDSLRVLPNRRRVGRDSTEVEAVGYDRGILPGGPSPDGFWERDGDALEIRIPWLLINVTDPSSRRVLANSGAAATAVGRTADGMVVLPSGQVVPPDTLIGDLGAEVVEDIGIVAGLRRAAGGWTSFPAAGAGPARFTWPTWEADGVRWRARRRPVFDAMRETYGTLDPYGAGTLAGAAPEEPRPEPEPAVPQEDPADAAWRAGDTPLALTLYLERLAADPADGLALHRVALMRAWEERYTEALEHLDRLLAVEPGNLDARVDHARVRAWGGDVPGAIEELERFLEEHPDFPPALEARATFEAWAGRYEASLSTYDQLLAIAPDNAAARRQQAQVLSWASRFEASRAAYDSLLAADPADVEARLGLGRVLTFSGDTPGAVAAYERVLADHPGHVGALQGLGRALSWAGRLVDGEGAYRRAVEADGSDVSSLVGLAQVLRWQGRNAAALEVLERAGRLDPSDGDVREQRRWVDVALGSQIRPSVVAERDSDDNRMLTTSVSASWYPVPRLALRADAYQRDLEQNALARSALGLTVSGSWQAEPGWTLSAALGGSENDGSGKTSLAAWSLGVESPGRYPYSGVVRAASYALDATAVLAERGVRLTELGFSGRWTPSPGWRVDGALGRATFQGTESNQRTNFAVAASRRAARVWTLGAGIRSFTFEKDLGDGYFDPDYYGIAELTGRWLHEPDPWSFLLEIAPGVQQVTRDGDPAGAFRTSARLAYRVGPGRELSLSAGYSTTGLQSFSTGASDYRYTAVILGGSWVF
ncbi:MAG: tetratricopeptide repeat protein [Longimicrobiales bacterium]|nr:tetratricopeptide repeat protein [Longimicrobiales bacterium]